MRVWLHPAGGRAVQTEASAGSRHSRHAGTLHWPNLVSPDGGFVLSTFLISPYSPRFPSHCRACGRRPVGSDSSMWRLLKPLPPASCSVRPARPLRNCPHHHLRVRAKLPLTGENVGLLFKETPCLVLYVSPQHAPARGSTSGGKRPRPTEAPLAPPVRCRWHLC